MRCDAMQRFEAWVWLGLVWFGLVHLVEIELVFVLFFFAKEVRKWMDAYMHACT